MPRLSVQLYEHLTDGFVVVSKSGSLRYANRAARGRLGLVLGERLHPGFAETLLRWVELGFVSMPGTFAIPPARESGMPDRLFVTVAEVGTDGDLAMVVRPEDSSRQWEGLCAQALRNLSDRVNAAFVGVDPPLSVRALMDDLYRRIEAVEQSDGEGPECIALAELFAEAVSQARFAAAARRVLVRSDLGALGLTVVFGCRGWLSWVLADLLLGGVEAVADGGTVLVRTARRKENVYVWIHYAVAEASPAGPASRATLGWSLCERTLRRHGAALRQLRSPEEPVRAIEMRFPASASRLDPVVGALHESERESEALARAVLGAMASRAPRRTSQRAGRLGAQGSGGQQ